MNVHYFPNAPRIIDISTNWVSGYIYDVIKIQSDSWNCGLDIDLGYLCTVPLTLEIRPWVKVMTYPWNMDNNCVKYYQDSI